MPVDIELYGPYRDIVGSKRVSVDIASETRLVTAIERIVDRWPDLANKLWAEEGKLASGVILLKNGTPISGASLSNATLSPGDTLSIAPAISGG